MGGYGSGRQGLASPKQTVESCLVLSAARLQRDRMIVAGRRGTGILTWTRVRTGEKVAAAGYSVSTLDGEPPTIRLDYTWTRWGEDQGEHMEYPVGLTTTPLPWGGVRWWFVCPLVRNGVPCGRRVGKLYLPPGARYFGCRHCHGLTYMSCQESHKFDGLYRMLAAETGTPPAVVKGLLNRRRASAG